MVLGVSKSGSAVADYLLDNGAECYLFEELKTEKVQASINRLIKKGAKFVAEEEVDKVVSEIDVVVISPGIAINHRVSVKAKQQGKRIIGELEFGILNLMPTFIAVTGTNGKTTTVSLINAVLKENNTKTVLVGNVGNPLTAELNNVDKDTVCVTEVSSFQMESTNSICPHVSCILNISPDHLERHYNMNNYIFLKKKIFKNQTQSEFVVLNDDDKTVREFYAECTAKPVFVSTKNVVDGAYVKDGKIYFKNDYITDIESLPLSGEHNVYNCLFAIAVSKILGVSDQVIVSALGGFKGVRHRTELVLEKNGVKYYNDSKATNTASTISAIDSMKTPTVLILGGSEKGETYDALFQKIAESNVKHVILTGASRFNMLNSANKTGYGSVTMTEDFYLAVKIASMIAEFGDNVLLSPACASFDKFSGFEERGEAFCNEVKKICEA